MVTCKIFQIVISIFFFNLCTCSLSDDWDCQNRLDQALVKFINPANVSATVYFQYTECRKCGLIPLAFLNTANSFIYEKVFDSFYNYKFSVIDNSTSSVLCKVFEYDEFKECGIYSFNIQTCSITVIKAPLAFNSNNYIYIGLAIAFTMVIIVNVFIVVYGEIKKRRREAKESLKQTPYSNSRLIFYPVVINQGSEPPKVLPARKPLLGLDTFRGLTVLLILFVFYGAGGYKQLQGRPWHGLYLGSILFPWFLWCAGMAIPIALHKFIETEKLSGFQVFSKIFATFAKKFTIGLMLGSLAGVYPQNLRIFGILQRVATTYLVIATLELIFYKTVEFKKDGSKWTRYIQDLIHAWRQWICVLILIALWLFLTFLLKPPGCPRGYFGPGGLDHSSKYVGCTGGAAGYIDRQILTSRHMGRLGGLKRIYQTDQAFEDEGILSTLMACVTVYLGVIAGRIFLFYKSNVTRIILWSIWAFFTFSLFGVLSFFDFYNGPIPVNAHLWTLSYVFLIGCMSFAIFIVFYVVIDILQWWDGAPFMYIGINPILIFILFSLLINAFPIQWIVNNNHPSLYFLHFWGCAFWTAFAAYLYQQNMVLIL